MHNRLGNVLVLITVSIVFPAPAHGYEAASVRDGEPLIFEREESSTSGAVIRLAETEGHDVVIRLVPMDAAGNDVGPGEIVVILARETREIRSGNVFAGEARSAPRLRVETRSGTGVVSVTTNDSAVRILGSNPSRRRAVGPPAPRPSSNTLIDQAEESGALDSQTALVYRVFALFGDARLPPQYRGDDRGLIDSLYLDQVVDRFDTLSVVNKALLRPFLIPPAYEGSYANRATEPSAAAIAFGPPPCEFFSVRWVHAVGNNVKVWYPVDPDTLDADRVKAENVVAAVDSKIWPMLTGIMIRTPMSDAAVSCNGGDGKLDIYIDDIDRSFYAPFGSCSAGPGYIVLSRSALNDTVAHEVFHAIQGSYNRSGCLSSDEFKWWTEGTATWGQVYVYPTFPGVHEIAKSFLNDPEKPLDFRNDKHEYGTYLLPFFLEKFKNFDDGLVRTTWESVGNQTPIEALDDLLPGRFAVTWPEFAVANWNVGPVHFYKPHGMNHRAISDTAGALLFGTPNEDVQKLKVDLPSLSATYKHYIFHDIVSLLVFYNGATSDLTLEPALLPGDLQYRTKSVSSAEIVKHIRVQALIKINGSWKTEDWTGRQRVEFCRDVKSERIEELVVIISNSNTDTDADNFEPVGLDPVLLTSNIGCHRWVGAVIYNNPAAGGLKMTSYVTYQFDRTNGWRGSGTQTYTFSETCSGGDTRGIPAGGIGTLAMMMLSPRQSPWFRSYWAAVSDSSTVLANCPGSPGPVPFPVMSWWRTGEPPPLATGNPNARYLLVSENGKKIEGSYREGVWSWTWSLESLRED